MPPIPTSSDPFTALAEPRRREIVELLAETEHRTVNDLVDLLGIPQPSVSKHLGVLRKVGLVTVQKNGQHRFYALNPIQLKPVHDWIVMFEHFWADHLDAIKKAAEKKARERNSPPPNVN
jgi:DNA-binding transcriptional ArsR family regulator